MGQSFDDRGNDGEELSPQEAKEFYRQQYKDKGFNDFAADHLSNIPSWEPASGRAFFGRSTAIAVGHLEYADTSELVRDLAGEVTTRTEVFLLQGLAEGYILNDFSHTALHQRACKGMKSAVNPRSVFFNETEGLWWPSIGEHFHAVDYYPTLQSFTQLTHLFAAAHYDPDRVRTQFEDLKRDELLFDADTQRWCERKVLSCEDMQFDRSYTSRDQLMAVLVHSLLSREEAAAELSRYLSSDLFRNGAPVRKISRYSEPEEGSDLDRLLLTAAKIFVADPRDRRQVIQECKEDPTGGFNKDTGVWYTPPENEWRRNSSDAAMQRLLSVILNTIASPGERL
jgi:hypothetical protein